MSLLKWLEDWFNQNCDGDWEHCEGIRIATLDNPGWFIQISLIDTDIEGKYFKPLKIERSDFDWIHCNVEDGIFKGFGGVRNLEEILDVFRVWALCE
ncbi:immunity 53 family protein [Paenibacillus alginolyticus]|uniref:Immunity 53 family protein n=1 Tax=Paenibacillus alginolyticus TaxID=59839 RepID=A0ABT4GP97_9BACL|nr:immunity 53 family protein [Paenibacillus alginolyticus]MCY9670815.1 immunity 53 family protein [Paenibacillus alginolyticus]MCY9698032.1 immunity 53 family protein [Paenibacillus alginolyticus]MEC0147916.1 immunity 53 family protein [Paenibacillus alginolyticus]